MRYIWGTLIIGWAMTAGAAESWNLDRAWAYAQTNSPLLQAAGHAIGIAEEEKQIAQSGYAPTINLSGNLRKIDSDRAASTMGLYPEYEGSFSARAEQRLFSLGIDTRIDIAKLQTTIAALGQDSQKRDLAYRIGSAFVTIAYQKVVRDIYASKRERIQSYLEISQAKYEAGSIDIGDTLRWESERADISAKLLQAETQIALVKSTLKNHLGMPQGNPLSIEIDEQAVAVFTGIQKETFLGAEALPNPNVQALEEEIQIAEVQKGQLVQSRYTPELSLYGEGKSVVYKDGEGADIHLDRDRNSYDIGVEAKLALYEGGYKSLESERQRLKQLQASSQIKTLENSLAELQTQALKNLQSNQEVYTLSRKSAEKADAFLRTRKKQYEEGAIDITPILDAEEYATLSNLNQEQNRFVLMQNRIDLAYALNRLPVH